MRNDVTAKPPIMPQTVEAEYFKLEDDWFTFKTADHKAVLTANAEDVRSVERSEPEIVTLARKARRGAGRRVGGRVSALDYFKTNRIGQLVNSPQQRAHRWTKLDTG